MFKRIFFALFVAISLCAQAMTQTPSPESPNPGATLDERLGADDGAVLAILFGANMRGNLETCD